MSVEAIGFVFFVLLGLFVVAIFGLAVIKMLRERRGDGGEAELVSSLAREVALEIDREIVRTSKEGERLADGELEEAREDRCPDCGGEGFLAGPRGGMCQNFKCANPECGSRFNDMGPFGVERISNASPDRVLQ